MFYTVFLSLEDEYFLHTRGRGNKPFLTHNGGGTGGGEQIFLHTGGNKHFSHTVVGGQTFDVGKSVGVDDADGEETEGVNKGNTSRREASKLSAGAIIH